MKDLILKASNLTSLMSKLKGIDKKLTHIDEELADQFSQASHDHALHVFSPLVVTPETYDEDGLEITPPVLDNGTFALLRTTDEIAAVVETIPGAPSIVLTGAEKDQVLAYRDWA